MQTNLKNPCGWPCRTSRFFSLAMSLLMTLLGAFDAPGASDSASAESRRNVDGIRDNSFLIEEAYNQEPGVVQHIFNASYSVDRRAGLNDKIWNLTFTQEWPVFSQTHQFSYTIPYRFIETGGRSHNGVGDILLNYR